MKKSLAIAIGVCASCVIGADNAASKPVEVYAHNDSAAAHSYITVDADYSIYDAITFDIFKTDWWYGSDRPRGTVGYFTYEAGTFDSAPTSEYIQQNGHIIPDDAKSFTVTDMTPETRVGFFTVDGGEVEGGTAKATEQLALIQMSALHNQTIPDSEVGYYIADFDTVRDPAVSDVTTLMSGKGYHLDDYGFIDYWTLPGGENGGYGRDWMGFKPRIPSPSGAPLPGAFAIFLVGGLGAGALKLRKRRS